MLTDRSGQDTAVKPAPLLVLEGSNRQCCKQHRDTRLVAAMAASVAPTMQNARYPIGGLRAERLWLHAEQLTCLAAGLFMDLQSLSPIIVGQQCYCGCYVYPPPFWHVPAARGTPWPDGGGPPTQIDEEAQAPRPPEHDDHVVGTPLHSSADAYTWAPGVGTPAKWPVGRRMHTALGRTSRYGPIAPEDDMVSEVGDMDSDNTSQCTEVQSAGKAHKARRKKAMPQQHHDEDFDVVLREFASAEQAPALPSESDAAAVRNDVALDHSTESSPVVAPRDLQLNAAKVETQGRDEGAAASAHGDGGQCEKMKEPWQ